MVLEDLQIAVSQGSTGQTILSLKGPLSIHTLFKFQEAVRSESSPVVIVDFGGVPFIDSAGLGALVSAHVSRSKTNRKVVLVGLNKQVRTLIEMTKVHQLFHSYKTLPEAEAAAQAQMQQSP